MTPDASQPAAARLNWGCGPQPPPGWINADREFHPGVNLHCDIRDGLPLPAGQLDYAVSIHALQDLPWPDIVPALREIRRVLRPGGVLRLGLPDLDLAIDAYHRGDAAYFCVPDEDACTVGGKFVTQMVWYGSTRTLMTFDFVQEMLKRAGFGNVQHCAFRRTRSAHADIVSLDNRERESFFVEAVA